MSESKLGMRIRERDAGRPSNLPRKDESGLRELFEQSRIDEFEAGVPLESMAPEKSLAKQEIGSSAPATAESKAEPNKNGGDQAEKIIEKVVEAATPLVVGAFLGHETGEAENEKEEQRVGKKAAEEKDKRTKEIEKSLPAKSFEELTNELLDLVDHPDPTKESELRRDYLRYISIANDPNGINLFNDPAFGNLKAHMRLATDNERINIEEARRQVEKVRTDDYERLFSYTDGYTPKYGGILTAYVNGALRNIDIAMLRAQGKIDSVEGKRLLRERNLLGWGTDNPHLDSKAREYFESLKPIAPISVPTDGPSIGEEEVYRGMNRFQKEREPSLDLALEEFHRAERMCDYYTPESQKLIMDKTQSAEARRIFDIESRIFNAALIKRFQGGGSLKGMAENNSTLKSISMPEFVFLFTQMDGYLEAMQYIAKIVVNRSEIPGLGYSLLDCRDQAQFISAANAIERLVRDDLVASGKDPGLASNAVSAAINTMYILNVFENYNTFWVGEYRYKYIESRRTAEPGKEGPILYDRLVAKPIFDSLNPMDDFISEALKLPEKKPVRNNLIEWAHRELFSHKITKPDDFDVIRVVGYDDNDARSYWTIKNETFTENGVMVQKRVLNVPRLRPSKLWGSVLDQVKVRLVGPRNEKIPFIEALAQGQEIDFDNTDIAPNATALYTLDAEDGDTLKAAFRSSDNRIDADQILKALGSFGLGNNLELKAWLYAQLTNSIEYKKHKPTLEPHVVSNTFYTRRIMGLPYKQGSFYGSFKLLRFLSSLKQSQKLAYK